MAKTAERITSQSLWSVKSEVKRAGGKDTNFTDPQITRLVAEAFERQAAQTLTTESAFKLVSCDRLESKLIKF